MTTKRVDGIDVLDPGHKYELHSLDGEHKQVLQFVKRHDPENPERFPGNTESYPGTTLQCVIRALLERMHYLDNQIPCLENKIIIHLLKNTIWLLERRAARRHGVKLDRNMQETAYHPICATCGHIVCDEHCEE